MRPRYKGAVNDRDIDHYFPVRVSVVIYAGLPPPEWSVKYTAMCDWLGRTVGNSRYAVVSATSPGKPDTMRVLFASFDDARAFVERFDLPIVPIGENPRS